MYSKIFVSVLFSILFALAAVAVPQTETQPVERDLNSIWNTFTSSLVADATNAGASVLSSGIHGNSSNAALVPYAGGVQTSLLVALGSVLVSALLGMTMVL